MRVRIIEPLLFLTRSDVLGLHAKCVANSVNEEMAVGCQLCAIYTRENELTNKIFIICDMAVSGYWLRFKIW